MNPLAALRAVTNIYSAPHPEIFTEISNFRPCTALSEESRPSCGIFEVALTVASSRGI